MILTMIFYHNGDLDKEDVDQNDDLGEEDVDASHLFPHGDNHGHHQAGDHYKLLHCQLFLCHFFNAILLQTLLIKSMLCHVSEKFSQMLFWFCVRCPPPPTFFDVFLALVD